MDSQKNTETKAKPEQVVKKRSAWVAFILSFACPGLGHIYCGKLKKGVWIFVIYFFSYSVLFGILKLLPGLFIYLFTILVMVAFSLYIYVDAIKIALRNKSYELRNFNRWYVYSGILFVYVFIISPIINVAYPERFGTPSGAMENTLLIGDRVMANDLAYGLHIPLTEYYINRYNSPRQGDVVYFKLTHHMTDFLNEENVKYTKRIIGIPGDTIRIVDKIVFINGIRRFESINIKFLIGSINPNNKPNPKIFPAGSKWNEDNYGPLYIPRQGDLITLDVKKIESWKQIIESEENEVRTQGIKILINGMECNDYKVKFNYYFVMGDNRDNSLDSRYIGLIPEEDILGKLTMIYWSWDSNISISDPIRLIASIRWNRIGTLVE